MKLITAKMTLAQKLPIAAGAALLLTAGTGAAAYALVAQSTDSPGHTGNTLPIDDNHRSISRTPLPAQDRVATPARPAQTADDHGTDAPEAKQTDAPEVGDDTATHAPEVADDHGTDAPEVGDDHGSDDSSGSGSGSSGGGSEDSGSGGHH